MPTAQPVADDRFRLASLVTGYPEGIGIRGVDEIEAGGEEGIQQPERGWLVRSPPEDVAAQGERRDLQPRGAELAFDHGSVRKVQATRSGGAAP